MDRNSIFLLSQRNKANKVDINRIQINLYIGNFLSLITGFRGQNLKI